MPARAPNYFDELPRMRQSTAPYNPTYDYTYIVRQLSLACDANHFIGISPQNVARGMPLLPVIASRRKRKLNFFIDPYVIKASNPRARYEACGNIYLMRGGRKFNVGVLVMRPRRLTLSARDIDGRQQLYHFVDEEPRTSLMAEFVGVICHELEHLHGRLIVDHAREALVRAYDALITARSMDEKSRIAADMPFVFARDGDRYVLRHGMEYSMHDVPSLSPDALIVSPHFEVYRDIGSFRVPRGGELLSIHYSDLMRKIFER